MNKNITRLVLTALFAALIFVVTYFLSVPAGSIGNINLGDMVILLSVWLIGGVYGGLAAGIGAALADLLSGEYAFYAPATFLIKFLMAFVAYLIFKAIKKLNINQVVAYILSGIVAELIMIAGYFFYESIILGDGFAAVPNIGNNAIQGTTSLILGFIIIMILVQAKVVKQIKKYV